MPLDPSIISSYNPTPGVDVNALMNQRMQGMANINAMERQRQADALALEDRAAAQQKEQAAALVTTLAPAYATAFKGKGTKEAIMAGYNILPPDVQATVKPQIDSLMSMPSDDLRLAALESSLAGSDLGRTLLDRIPTEIQRINADIQQGQLTLAQQKFAAEQAAGPEASYTHVKGPDGKVYLMNTKTGEMKMPTVGDGTDINAGTALPEGMDAKTKTKFDQALPKAKAALRTTFSAYANDIADVQALLADDAGIAAITGAFNAYTPDITKDATRAAGLLRKIRAGNMFSALQELRVNSPTGAAVGNVSNEEGRNLRDSVAALDRAQSPEDFKRALAKLAVDLEVARRNVAAAFDDTYGYRNDIASTDIETEARAIREAAEREIGKTSLPPALPSGVTVTRTD